MNGLLLEGVVLFRGNAEDIAAGRGGDHPGMRPIHGEDEMNFDMAFETVGLLRERSG
jgi:hypothetical protein